MRNITLFFFVFATAAFPRFVLAQKIFATGFENDIAQANVTWKSDTQLIEGDALSALISADPVNGIYQFDTTGLANAGVTLNDGDVLIVSGEGLGRMTSIQESGGTTTVNTDAATLDEAIQSGQLLINMDVGFDQIAASTVQFGKTTCSPTIEGLTVTFECSFDDYTLNMSVTGGRDSSSIQFLVRKGGENANASFTGTGTLSRFNQMADINYAAGALSDADIQTNGLQLDISLELAAAGSGSSQVSYDVPFPIFSIPFSVGPIPVTVDIGAEVLAILTVPASFSASATGRADFSYNGDTGLTYDGSKVEITTQTTGINYSNGSFDSAGLLGVGLIEATFGIAFPRVSLNVVGAEVGYVLSGLLLRSIYYEQPICKEARTELVVQGGYGLTILGIDLVSPTDIVLDRDRLVTPAGGCPQSDL